MKEVRDFFAGLLDTSDWPPRWHCGTWTAFHGWLYIISDLLIWSAYFAMPVVILKFMSKRSDLRFVRLYILFAAFILACGATHFLDALSFWIPMYRLSALVRAITGIVSWVTLYYLIRYLPVLASLRSRTDLELEIEQRKIAEARFQTLTDELDERIRERTAELSDYKYAMDESSVVSVTDQDGIIRHVNDNFCRISKYAREELMGQDHRIVNSGYHPDWFMDHLWVTIASGKIWHGEMKNRARDGTAFWVDTTIVPFLTKEGPPHQYVAIMCDVTARKKDEEQQILLASIINFSDEAIISIDMDSKITSWNRGAENLFHYPFEEVYGKPITMLIAPARQKEELSIIDRIAHGAYIKHYETERIRRDGGVVCISLNISPIKDADGKIIGASKIVRDITERKQAESARREMEGKIKAKTEEMAGVLEKITDGFIVLDHNLCYTYVNKRIGEMTGRETGSLIGKYIWNEFPDAVQSATYYAFNRAMAEQRYVSNTDYYPALDLWQENHIYPGPEGLSVFIRDITLQKRAEEKLRESENTYKAIASSIPGSAICLFDAECRYLLIEGDMFGHLGYDPDKSLGRKAEEVLHPDVYAALAENIQRVFRGETFTTEGQEMEYDLVNRFVPLRNDRGKIYAAMIVSIDVTELKSAHGHISELNTSLERKVAERTEQLAVVNQELEAFTYSVSHDLRAPLRVMDGFADILATDHAGVLDAEARRIIGVIKSNARRMGQLIDDLLDLSRMGRQEIVMTKVNMNEMVSSVIAEQLRLYGDRPVDIISEPLLPAVCDSSLLRQVWINLISNGLKYTGKMASPEIRIGSLKRGDKIIYSVKDNGVGFDMKYAHKLFGVFQRLHKITEFEGTGVGLALVQRIIVRHGGEVWAESELGKGATFFFSLRARKQNE